MKVIGILTVTGLMISGCASTSTSDESNQRVVVIHNNDQMVVDTGGIPPEKQAEILLVLQQRDSSARRCYQDVLNEKHSREFKGSVKMLLTISTGGRATTVRIMGGTLHNREVEECLVSTVKEFEFPTIERGGDIQYEYRFEPQY